MKKNGKYRFSLQFGMDSEAQICAGEFLEHLGNKKSAVIVAALNDYLDNNPELKSPTLKITISEKTIMQRERLEALIRGIVEDRLAQISFDGHLSSNEKTTVETLGNDIAQMVNNLDMFRLE